MDDKIANTVGLTGLAGIGGYMGYLIGGALMMNPVVGIVVGALLLPGYVLSASQQN